MTISILCEKGSYGIVRILWLLAIEETPSIAIGLVWNLAAWWPLHRAESLEDGRGCQVWLVAQALGVPAMLLTLVVKKHDLSHVRIWLSQVKRFRLTTAIASTVTTSVPAPTLRVKNVLLRCEEVARILRRALISAFCNWCIHGLGCSREILLRPVSLHDGWAHRLSLARLWLAHWCRWNARFSLNLLVGRSGGGDGWGCSFSFGWLLCDWWQIIHQRRKVIPRLILHNLGQFRGQKLLVCLEGRDFTLVVILLGQGSEAWTTRSQSSLRLGVHVIHGDGRVYGWDCAHDTQVVVKSNDNSCYKKIELGGDLEATIKIIVLGKEREIYRICPRIRFEIDLCEQALIGS